jgi:prevent-host-death family protein
MSNGFKRVSMADLRAKLGDVINQVYYGDNTIELERKGETVAYIVPKDLIQEYWKMKSDEQEQQPVKKLAVVQHDEDDIQF